MTLASVAAREVPNRTPGTHSAFLDVWVLTVRNLTKVLRVPQLLFFSLVQPVIFLTLFSQVFRSITETPVFRQNFPNVTYIQYLVPAVIATTVSLNASNSGTGMATDLHEGVIDRFRSLPIMKMGIPVARSLSDVIRASVQSVFMLAVGVVIFGFRFDATWWQAVLAIAIVLPLNWALTWVFIAFGTFSRNAETTQLVGFMITLPLMFASSAYVPVESLPGWMQAIAEVNPLSYTIDAARDLALGFDGAITKVWQSLAADAVVAAVGITMTVIVWRRTIRQ